MNIPQDTLQAVADAAFAEPFEPWLSARAYHMPDWKNQECARRAVIHHALSNPALAPFLAGVGEFTDQAIYDAWKKAVENNDAFPDRMRDFLAALPRRESPALAEAIARAEKAEKELAALKSAQLGILRPISEMPETVPDGCMVVFRWRDDFGSWVTGTCEPTNGFFAILRLPAAEATPPAEPDPYAELKAAHADGKVVQVNIGKWVNPEAEDMWEDREYPAWDIDPEFYRIKPEPAAQVPLGPEDCPPGSAFRFAEKHWYNALYVSCEVVCLISGDSVTWKDWNKLQDDGWQINTSLPDTGRWDANAWRPCSKPGK